MTERFLQCLQFVLKWEGGYSNHPNDPGGATYRGITQRVYNGWRRKRKLPEQDVRKMTDAEMRQIYWELYWQPARCSQLPKPLDLVVFDTAVNMGVARSTQFLRRVLLLKDGFKWTDEIPKKLKSVKGADFFWLIHNYCEERKLFYRKLVNRNPKLRVFLRGWLNRVEDLLKTVYKEV